MVLPHSYQAQIQKENGHVGFLHAWYVQGFNILVGNILLGRSDNNIIIGLSAAPINITLSDTAFLPPHPLGSHYDKKSYDVHDRHANTFYHDYVFIHTKEF